MGQSELKANKLLNLTANTARFLCVRYRSLSHKNRAALAAKLARRYVYMVKLSSLHIREKLKIESV